MLFLSFQFKHSQIMVFVCVKNVSTENVPICLVRVIFFYFRFRCVLCDDSILFTFHDYAEIKKKKILYDQCKNVTFNFKRLKPRYKMNFFKPKNDFRFKETYVVTYGHTCSMQIVSTWKPIDLNLVLILKIEFLSEKFI